jgi:hypothetical protein
MRAVVAGVAALVLVACGGRLDQPSDGGVDGGTDAVGPPCASGADCPAGDTCFFPVSEGCAAKGQCFPFSPGCKGGPGCTCNDQTSFVVCGPPGYASEPIQYAGKCASPPPPPPTCASGLACEQCDVTGFVPSPMALPLKEIGACSQPQITDFVTACVSAQATAQTCSAWESAADGGACVACLMTQTSASTWGPLVCTSSQCTFNVGGCVDLVLHLTSQETSQGGAGSCGDLLTASYGCQDYACGTCTSTSDFGTCAQSATANECAGYVAQTGSLTGPCGTLDGDGGTLAQTDCFAQDSSSIGKLVNVFCGSGP